MASYIHSSSLFRIKQKWRQFFCKKILFLFLFTWKFCVIRQCKRVQFLDFHTIFFLWDFPLMFYVIETKQHKKKCLGIPQHLFCRSAWRSYRNQWLQSIHQKAIPILLTLAYVIFFFLLYDSYPIPQQRNFFPLLSSVKEISK